MSWFYCGCYWSEYSDLHIFACTMVFRYDAAEVAHFVNVKLTQNADGIFYVCHGTSPVLCKFCKNIFCTIYSDDPLESNFAY